MASLATAADLAGRLGRALTESEATRAPLLLTDASALVRKYCRLDFNRVDNDTVVLHSDGNMLRLPKRPVLAVDAVKAVGCAGQADTVLSGWCWDGTDRIDLDGATALDTGPHGTWRDALAYRVTLDHGYDTIPDDVVAIVCAMVNRTLTSPTQAEGLTSERIGQYAYQFAQFPGGTSPGPGVRLTPADKQALADAGYRRRAGTSTIRLV